MNPKAYGVIVQLALIFSGLTIAIVSLVVQPISGHDVVLLVVGALCTAMGNVIAKNRTDNADGGGSGYSQRPPRLDVSIPPPAAKIVVPATTLLPLLVAFLAVLLCLK